ncbi:MAG TPA: YggS family pyridoxal phosphate-dependent enzyme [Clostridiales bacterium]|jgi:pyridoxal phosphate enzyme (YggS family)|nr:YggS family pyridoxal phosphate-dependent enzyme [Clostridiales bacterium]
MELKERLEKVRYRIHQAAQRAGTSPEYIRLVAVTKTVDINRINHVLNLGITDIGENRVQEMLSKYGRLSGPVNWHFIGYLQTNKVKYIVDKTYLIHSLDRIKLADKLNKAAEKSGRVLDVLVQVNVSGEDTKYGVPGHEYFEFVKRLEQFPNIRVKGLMTIAPFVEDEEQVRPYFKMLRELYEETKAKLAVGKDMEYLSMGMTNDYRVAIEEGANMIRLGTALFGERHK